MATKRINVCVYCKKEFIRKTLIKNGVNAGKYAYSRVKYCDEHKHLSFGKGGNGKSNNNALLKWRESGGQPWNKGLKDPNASGRKLPNCMDCDKTLGSYADRCKPCAGKLRSGANNHNWNGGITKKDKLERRKFAQTIRKQVFKRDNHACQMCDKKGCFLQVDHIQSWKDYVELRFDMNNCRTLCMDCHYFVTFGKKKPKDIVWGLGVKNPSSAVGVIDSLTASPNAARKEAD